MKSSENSTTSSDTSLTMSYALGPSSSSTTVLSKNPNLREIGMHPSVQPRSRVEHYWAARALKAETLLSARIVHHQELRSLTSEEELKRSQALKVLARESDAKLARMEKFVLVLLGSLLFFALLVVYLLTHPNYRNHPPPSHWSLPSHFTIPILSPFTSVTEHESSVVGTRLVTVFLVILAVLGYVLFRHRVARLIRR